MCRVDPEWCADQAACHLCSHFLRASYLMRVRHEDNEVNERLSTWQHAIVCLRAMWQLYESGLQRMPLRQTQPLPACVSRHESLHRFAPTGAGMSVVRQTIGKSPGRP